VADEPVSGEPVCEHKFPASREFAGNFSEFEPDQAKGVWLGRVDGFDQDESADECEE